MDEGRDDPIPLRRTDDPRPTPSGRQGSAEERLLTISQVVDELGPHYPDLTISSLRFLEREGLLMPRRTPGGHRLFTGPDIERIRHIKDLQRQRYSLEEIRQHLRLASQMTDLPGLGEAYLRHILAGQRAHALALVTQAVNAGIAAAEIYLHVLTPAMTRVGEMLAEGAASVADEHLATAITRDAMAMLKAKLPARPPQGLRAVAAGAPGELHELGLRMVADLFESAGWTVDYLGPNTPIDALLDFMARRPPHVLLTAAGSPGGLAAAADLIAAIRAARSTLGHIVIGVGGPAFAGQDNAWREIGADFYARRADQAVDQALALVSPR